MYIANPVSKVILHLEQTELNVVLQALHQYRGPFGARPGNDCTHDLCHHEHRMGVAKNMYQVIEEEMEDIYYNEQTLEEKYGRENPEEDTTNIIR